jgi:endogenous inhibitor of DNA gyrase (YacG/DUF329 family)
MYCPNCGQQQVSDEMRFCSRCGLALSGLAEWLAGGLPVRRADEAPASTPSRRRKAFRRAAKLMFFSVALFPIFLAISIGIDEPGPLFPPLILFFVSLMWMAYSRLFIDDNAPMINQSAQPSIFRPAPARESLPPANTTAMPDISRQRVRTNELVQMPSVTEHTTKLLDNE